MKSTIGRPRALTDAEVQTVLAWHQQVMAWRALGAGIKTRKQLARELNVSPSTITRIIACHGEFKQASPESTDEVALVRRGRALARMR